MVEKQEFVRRFGQRMYDTFVFWLREDAVSTYHFEKLGFFIKSGAKHPKRGVMRSLHRNVTKTICKETLATFKTREDLLSYIHANRETLGFHFDKAGILHTGWRYPSR